MSNQARVVKVLAALLVSMTMGAIALMALGTNPPSAGPFSLAIYCSLDPVERTVSSRAAQTSGRWNCIEIYYSGTKGGNLKQLAHLNGLPGTDDINCHFVICNGNGSGNGQILTTERWQKQWPVVQTRTWYGTAQTIRVCIIADSKTTRPTDFQTKRVEALTDALCRKFDIRPESVYYPGLWR